MSNSELPPASGQGGRSVFTVFGFTGSHYIEADDFDHPLETAPDSCNPAEVPETLRSRQRAAKFEEAAVEARSISYDAAHKMRLNLPDNTKLVLQSLGHSGSKANPGHHHQQQQSTALEKHQHFTRRYSNPQGEEVEDTFDTEAIEKFRTTVSDSSRVLLSQHHNTQKHLYRNWAACSKDDFLTQDSSSTSASGLPRRQSSPNLAGLGTLQILNTSKSFCLSPSESSVDPVSHSGALTAYISGQTADSKAVTNFVKQMDKDSNKDSNKPISQKLTVDTIDSSHSGGSGLGILARTRQFGAWLTKATEGEKVKVTKKDLNVLAPNSF
ncbi:uncharacterized protein LOC106071515 isoform X1 [Biomphalaria glabrata]|uniref:Uncharacterized protein LOC106071515 isoform X1 n=1 Tax=Biomphalaria glabrata TaxID=6526 RepID=A0A9U8EGS5_BIOGL|nr:uncharacterized protein LOC106071515 isoform X1 [Biomphalaria glabrata]